MSRRTNMTSSSFAKCALLFFLIQVVISVNGNDNVQCYCNKGNGAEKYQQPQQQKQQQKPQLQPKQQTQQHQQQNPPKPHQQQNPPKPQQQQNTNSNSNPTTTKSSCNYCTRDKCNPTIKPYPNFNAVEDCDRLYKAMKGAGTDESTLIDILTNRSEEQMREILLEYTRRGKSLKQAIRDDTSFKFKQLLLALATSRPRFYAEELHKALKNEDTSTLIEIMTSLSDCAMREVGVEYEDEYHESLQTRIEKETNLGFQKFILALANGNRDRSQTVNKDSAIKDAQALINAGVNKWFGKDDDTFNKIFSTRSFPQLREILTQYDSLRKPSKIEDDVEKKFDKKLEKGLLNLIKNIKDQPSFFADEIDDALNGWVGPKDNDKLVRILRGRSGIDLEDIRNNFDKRYTKKSLSKRINEDTYFEYRKALNSVLKYK